LIVDLETQKRRVDQALAAERNLVRQPDRSGRLRVGEEDSKLDLPIRRSDPALILGERSSGEGERRDDQDNDATGRSKPVCQISRYQQRQPAGEYRAIDGLSQDAAGLGIRVSMAGTLRKELSSPSRMEYSAGNRESLRPPSTIESRTIDLAGYSR
jgi:hypothetical protein